jgi:secretion/DNA translocation related CpaE-like protein
MNTARPLLVSGDPDLIDDVLRLAAANGVEVHLATDAESARSHWVLAPLVLIGADAALRLAAAQLPRRRDVVLVAQSPTPDDWQRAVSLGAEHVVSLPDAERWLIDRLADSGEGSSREGAVAAVVGAGGGAGASTFAAGLALAAAARSLRVLLVDADPVGGGLDVLLGVEDAAGVRWADLADTRGRLSAASLEQALPHLGGVTLLSAGREGSTALAPESLAAVLDAGQRGFDLVVVDLPRQLDPAGETVLARADEALLVCVTRVRSTAAAARVAATLQSRCASVGLVLRVDRRGVSEDAVHAALSLPIRARLPHVQSLASRADNGEPPSLRDVYGRACQAALRTMATTLARVA